jgi:hypothetical protein
LHQVAVYSLHLRYEHIHAIERRPDIAFGPHDDFVSRVNWQALTQELGSVWKCRAAKKNSRHVSHLNQVCAPEASAKQISKLMAARISSIHAIGIQLFSCFLGRKYDSQLILSNIIIRRD